MNRVAALVLTLLVSLVTSVAAQEPYPTRQITIVVAFPPGGLADLTARPLAAALEKQLKQPVVVVNKPGAAGAVGNQAVAIAKPDGYTLLLGLVSISVLPEKDRLFNQPPTYTLDQLTGIARLNAEPAFIAANAETPWKTLKELVDDAKKRSGQITFSSSGLYGASHIPFEMFLQSAGLFSCTTSTERTPCLKHLPTTGGAPMVTAMLGNHAQLTATPATLVAGHVKANKVRLLAHTGTGRLPAFPDVPALKELGYDVEYYAWAGLIGPKGIPPHVMKMLRDAVRQAVQDPELKAAMAKVETPVSYQDADEFNAWWARDAQTLASVVRKIGKVGN